MGIDRVSPAFKRHMTAPFLSRLGLLVASFVLAILAFAPTQALAHAGHNHGGGVVQEVPVTREVVLPSVSSEVVWSAKPAVSATAGANKAELTWLAGDLAPKNSKGCVGGCCQMAGAGCCPIFFTTSSPLVEPPLGHAVFSHLADRGAGITPGTLSKPPKSLV